ncbi:MAG: hypothetical protein SOW84_00915 [Candidatus Faecousia sp.]|nr:hypothetical protein [Candidatus Faecousia sp.]
MRHLSIDGKDDSIFCGKELFMKTVQKIEALLAEYYETFKH